MPLDARLRRRHGLTQTTGVLVMELVADGPGAAGGLARGDVVVALDGAPIVGVDDLHRALTAEQAGREVVLGVLRAGAQLAIRVVPEEA